MDIVPANGPDYKQYYYSYYLLEEFKWPYVSFIVNNEDIFIINLFKERVANRLSYRGKDESVVSSFISRSMNMFYLTFDRVKKSYQLYMLNLDNSSLDK